MMLKSLLVILSIVWNIQAEHLTDGNVYKLTSKLDNQVLTVPSNTTTETESGVVITVGPWQDETNQKWLAVEAVVAGDNYLLLPQRQKWNWNKFVRRAGGSLKDCHNDLPDWSLVLSVDNFKTTNKSVIQQYRDSKPYQQWHSIKIGNGSTHLIQNVATDLCLNNPGVAEEKANGFFQRVKQAAGGVFGHQPEKEKKSAVVQIVPCDRDNVGQQWILQVIN